VRSFQGMVIKGHDQSAPNVNCQWKVDHNRLCANYFAEKTKMDIVPPYLRPWQTKVIRFGMSSLGFQGGIMMLTS
jgi:hypothetical protein